VASAFRGHELELPTSQRQDNVNYNQLEHLWLNRRTPRHFLQLIINSPRSARAWKPILRRICHPLYFLQMYWGSGLISGWFLSTHGSTHILRLNFWDVLLMFYLYGQCPYTRKQGMRDELYPERLDLRTPQGLSHALA
jgi:hypothetical protein